LPYLVIAPASVILLIACRHILGSVLRRWQPKWTVPFISEQDEYQGFPLEGVKHSLGWTLALLTFTGIGFFAELVHFFPPNFGISAIVLLASWVSGCNITDTKGNILLTLSQAAAALVITAKRPRSCSILLLVFFTLCFMVEIILATASYGKPKFQTISRYIAASAALMACFTILLMPFRKPSLPVIDISAVGQTPCSDFRSPEDNLRLWQFLTVSWMAPLISLGRKRQLNEPDVWLLGFEFQHSRLHEKFRRIRGSVLRRVLQANGLDVLIIAVIAVVQMICTFSTPVLLQQLLQAMQDPTKPKRVPMTYAVLALVLRLVAAQSQVLNLWYGRRCYERSRGEMVMMVYEKALSRKNILGLHVESEQKQPSGEETVEGDPTINGVEVLTTTKPGFWGRLFSIKRKPELKKPKEAATLGKIFNLLRGDVYDVAQRFWEIDVLIDKPLGLVIAVVLVWTLFGPSCFLGILAVLVAQAMNAVITRFLLRRERLTRAATDARLQITSQFVEAIRHLRWYGWQDHWLRQVMEARQHELNRRIITKLCTTSINFINAFASGVFPVVALYAYTMLAGHELRIDVIFPALQLFTMLETRLREIPSLITALINSSIALGRIEDFMAEPDKEQFELEQRPDVTPFRLDSCSFAWPGKLTPVLRDINVTIPRGLTVVSGKVGAGKTAFLQALLGELDRLSGSCSLPNETIGYCAQTPWLQSMSIRDNILFSAPYEEQRYKRTLDACALLPDLSQFKHGDLTFIGENGVGLSGGQKARVALARAVYSAARVLLLDDPLSALDHNTAEFVVRKCLSGPLMQNRTIVLVTHRTALVRDIADQIIEINQSRAIVHSKAALSASTRKDGLGLLLNLNDSETETEEANEDEEAAAVPDKFFEEEHRAEWGVKARVYWNYIRAGKYRWWALLVLVLAIYRLMAVGQSWFLKEWGEAYNRESLSHSDLSVWQSYSVDTSLISISGVDAYFVPQNPIDQLPSPHEDVRPWLWTFFGIICFQAAALLVSQLLMLVIVYCAGKTLFHRVMVRVSHASFRFFDVTPVGRLMNRLTSDISVVDGNISAQFQTIAFYAITWISSILVIATATPTFLVFSLILTIAFVLIFLRFLPTSQSLRRLEMVSLTPLLSNFGELLHGLTTVRAFRAEERFQNRVISVVDKFQGMDHFYWSLQAWLMYRFESLSALSTFCLTVLALYTNTTPGLVAFVLIAANNFVDSTHALCKQYGQLQMDFVSVERIDELLHIEEEPKGTIDPPAAWPTYGSDVTFENVTLRYAPHLDPALKEVCLQIPGGSTTAVIGRTGSGKSTLAVSLLSVVRPETGRILIDGINIADVNTQALRTRVTFVAQDPVLFPGSVRLNLDPTEEFSDQQCADVLERLCGRHGWNLETHIEAGGKNLSQGQRQLIALTRAVLRRSPVVILDEATASIDHETSLEIQQIIREELHLSTVITIAHRVEAVKDAEYFVELDQGRVSRYGSVRDL
jgi:ABC-type multidrug transport system fused ATPase/permease subunit